MIIFFLLFFRGLFSLHCFCRSAFSYVQGLSVLPPSAKKAPAALLTLQRWLVVSGGSSSGALLGGRDGCGGLLAACKRSWETQWTRGHVAWGCNTLVCSVWGCLHAQSGAWLLVPCRKEEEGPHGILVLISRWERGGDYG